MNYETDKFIREYFEARPQLEPPSYSSVVGYAVPASALHMIESLLNERHELRQWKRRNRSAIARANNAEAEAIRATSEGMVMREALEEIVTEQHGGDKCEEVAQKALDAASASGSQGDLCKNGHTFVDGRCANCPATMAELFTADSNLTQHPELTECGGCGDDDCATCADSGRECKYCSQEMDVSICGHVSILRDGPMTCTRSPGHPGRHVACGAHHGIGSWPHGAPDESGRTE